jgi:hypothetical protein
MPRNPNKTHCSVEGCRAWAIRDSDPPLCAPHTPGKTGAPPGNGNALTHGFYAGALRPEDLEGIDPGAAVTSLLDEILRVRAAMCHIEEILITGGIPGKDLRPLAVVDYARFISLLLQSANTLTRLVRVHNSLRSNDIDEILAEIFGAALDDLSEEWGIDL